MTKLLYRQRRRFGAFAFTICLPLMAFVIYTGWRDLLRNDIAEVGLYIAAICFLAIACLALLAVPAIIIAFFPRWRSSIEYIALGALVGVAFWFLAGLIDGAMTLPVSASAIFFALFAAFFYFRVIDRILPNVAYRGRASFRTKDSAYRIWSEMIPDPAHLDRHWDALLQDITFDAKNTAVRYATYQIGDAKLEQRLTMLRENVGDGFSYEYTNVSAAGSEDCTGRFDVDIKDLGFCREVRMQVKTEKLAFLSWLFLWLDDMTGDDADYLAARALDQDDTTLRGLTQRLAPRRPPAPPKPTLAEEMAALDVLRAEFELAEAA